MLSPRNRRNRRRLLLHLRRPPVLASLAAATALSLTAVAGSHHIEAERRARTFVRFELSADSLRFDSAAPAPWLPDQLSRNRAKSRAARVVRGLHARALVTISSAWTLGVDSVAELMQGPAAASPEHAPAECPISSFFVVSSGAAWESGSAQLLEFSDGRGLTLRLREGAGGGIDPIETQLVAAAPADDWSGDLNVDVALAPGIAADACQVEALSRTENRYVPLAHGRVGPAERFVGPGGRIDLRLRVAAPGVFAAGGPEIVIDQVAVTIGPR